MRIQPIQTQIKSIRHSQKSRLSAGSPSFKANYNEVMTDVLSKDLRHSAYVEQAISDLYKSLIKENNIIKTAEEKLLSKWFMYKGTHLIKELCKPIADVTPELRDIVFKSKKEGLALIKQNNDDKLCINHLGKHGFWNSIFENESAPNDIRINFFGKDGYFEISTDSKGRIMTEQSWSSGFWKKNTYAKYTGERCEQKTGNTSDTFIMPPF